MKETKKMKSQYRDGIEAFVRKNGKVFIHYPNIKSRIHKKFSVYQELSLTKMHKLEYKEYNLKIRGKRDGSMPNPWDDYRSSVYDFAQSWKHNSKRKNQHYKEK